MRGNYHSIHQSRSLASIKPRPKPSLLNTYYSPIPPATQQSPRDQQPEPIPKLNLLEGVFRFQRKVQNDLKEAVREIGKSRKLLSISQEGSILQPCAICLNPMSSDFFPLSRCQHFFDQACLTQHIMMGAEEGRFPAFCPQKGCGAEICISDIALILSETQMERYYELSFKSYAIRHSGQMVGCPTPECKYYGFREEQDEVVHFCCPECGFEQCLKCKEPWHGQMTCEASRINSYFSVNDRKFQMFIKTLDYGKCPTCNLVVQRAEVLSFQQQGCTSIQCKCGETFCSICHRPRASHHPKEWQRHEHQKSQIDLDKLKQEKLKPKDNHSKWIISQRQRLVKKLEENTRFVAKPMPSYPQPPKTLMTFLSKTRKTVLLKDSEKEAQEDQRACTTHNSFYKSASTPAIQRPPPAVPRSQDIIERATRLIQKDRSLLGKKAREMSLLRVSSGLNNTLLTK